MAMNRDPRPGDAPDPVTAPEPGSGNAPASGTAPGSGTAPATGGGSIVVPGGREVTAPIVVPNDLWSSSNPAAYGGGQLPAITHLEKVEAEVDPGDNARWGALEVIPARADYLLDLLRMNSLWPLLSGLSCCAIEMMSSATSRNDVDRFNMFPFRASPRQADVLIVAGTLTTKMAGPLLRLWEQMPEPKWCVAMGDCTCSGGRFKRSYSVVQGIDRIMPVDVYVPGCPPRPEGLIYGMMKLQQLIMQRRGRWVERAVGPSVPAER